MLIGMLKDFEATAEGEEADFLTMITPHNKKKIPLSRFIDIFYNMMITGNDPKKEGWHLKYSNEFINIVEVRKSVLNNIHLYPQEIREILSEVTAGNPEEDYIDMQKIWNK